MKKVMIMLAAVATMCIVSCTSEPKAVNVEDANAVTTALTEAVEKNDTSLIQTTLEKVQEYVGTLDAEKAKEYGAAINTWLKDNAEKVAAIVPATVVEGVSTVLDKVSPVEDAVSTVEEAAADAAALPGEVADAVTETAENAVEGVKEAANNAVETGKAAVEAGKTAVENAGTAAKEAGKNAVNNAIDNAANSIKIK